MCNESKMIKFLFVYTNPKLMEVSEFTKHDLQNLTAKKKSFIFSLDQKEVCTLWHYSGE